MDLADFESGTGEPLAKLAAVGFFACQLQVPILPAGVSATGDRRSRGLAERPKLPRE